MSIKQKALAEIIEYLKSKGHNLDNFIFKWDNDKRIYTFYIKEKNITK